MIPTDTPTLEPITVEVLYHHLLLHSFKWQSLGEALSLDEDRLDEIYTNNERDEDCLREMLESYMMRSDLDHSWEEVENALKMIGIVPAEISPRTGICMYTFIELFRQSIHLLIPIRYTCTVVSRASVHGCSSITHCFSLYWVLIRCTGRLPCVKIETQLVGVV